MATTYYTDIQKLYVAYFNRPADPTGLAFWEKAVEAAKGSTAVVAAEFAKSAEYTAGFSGMTNAQIVDQVYKNLFGRGATDDGAKFWIDGLNNKVITVADVVTAVAAGAQGTDQVSFNNKVTGAAAFTAAVNTDAEIAGYTGAKANTIAKAFITSITDNVTLAAATTPAKLNETVGNAVAAGTPFTVAGSLANLSAAQTALDTFVKSVDVDNNPKTVTKVADITGDVTTKEGLVTAKLSSAAQTVYATGSDATKVALINAQVTDNATTLSNAQTALNTANTKVAAVAGLSAAISTLTATKATLTAANTAKTAADADLAAKAAAFPIANGGTVATTAATATVDGKIVLTVGSTVTTVATIKAGTGVVSVADGIDASKFAGLSAYVAAINADNAAISAVSKADLAVKAAQLEVNHTDIDSTTLSTVTGFTSDTEKTLLDKVTTAIKGFTDVTIADGATASEANITTELNILKLKSDTAGAGSAAETTYNTFKTLVDAYHTTAASNLVVATQTTATTNVTNATKAVTDFNKLVTDLSTAKAAAATLTGYQATLAAATKVFEDNGYHMVNVDADVTGTVAVGTAASDVFVVGEKSVDISLFNLQGKDALFIGTGFTLVKGAPTDTNADNAKLQAFVSQSGNDTVIQIETNAYSSSVASTAGEIVTIKLVGIDATTIGLDANGIITSGTAA